MTSSTAPEMYRQFQAFLADERRIRLDRFDDVTLAWLVLPPGWTGRLARAAGFPGWGPGLLAETEAQGLCHRSDAPVLDRPAGYALEVDVRLAAFLRPNERSALVYQVAGVPNDRTRASLVGILAPHLDAAPLDGLLAVADAVRDPAARVRALTALMDHLPPERSGHASGRALDAAGAVADPGERAEALLLVAEGLDDARIVASRVLDIVPALGHESERSRVLTRVAPYLPAEALSDGVELVLALRSPEWRARPLAALAHRLPVADAVGLLRTELATVGARSRAGADLTAAERTLARALAALGEAGTAWTASDGDQRQPLALTNVLDRLTVTRPSERLRALDGAELGTAADDADEQSLLALHQMVQQLVEQDGDAAALSADRAVNASVGIPDRTSAALLTEAVATSAQTHQDNADRLAADALRRIEGLLDPAERAQLYGRLLVLPLGAPVLARAAAAAVESTRAIVEVGDRVDALVALIPCLRSPVREQLVDEARTLAQATGEDASIWVTETTRAEVLQHLADGRGTGFLDRTTREIAARLTAAGAAMPLGATLERWTRLAALGTAGPDGPQEAAAWLDLTTKALIERRDSSQALAWIATGRQLAPVLGTALESVSALGMRRVELLHRQTLDRRHLRRFLPREQQVAAFDALVADGARWALHYIGVGGVGKTMLLRHLTSTVAPALSASTARVDFDHLNPDYPIRKPGQLLLELMDELQPFVPAEDYEHQMRLLRNRVRRLHEQAADGQHPDPLISLESPAFRAALDVFVDFLRRLPQPVILVLDTCEELAKAHADGTRIPPLEATFTIMERLHDEVDTLRVVFSGRRFLARSGAGWRATGDVGLLPASKDYLRLYEIRGFDPVEADRYLALQGHAARPADLIAEVLHRSRDVTARPRVVREPALPSQDVDRYNPFDLSLYANWLREEPSLTAAALRAETTDPYVAVRVVRRLRRHDVQRLLPAVALLGRFDRAMLRAAHHGDDATFEAAFLELSQQEWIEYQRGETTFLQVDRNLLPRLRAYYAAGERRGALDAARDLLRPGLAELARRLDLDDLGIDLLDAAMRLLTPDEACALWDDLDRRVREATNWQWAEQRVARLLSDEGALASPGHPARAAVRAAWISSLSHTRADYDATADWLDVADHVDAHPDPVIRGWLRRRATAGLVAACLVRRDGPTPAQLDALWNLLGTFPDLHATALAPLVEQLAASCCAAVEALVELAEERADPGLVTPVEHILGWQERIAAVVPPDVAVFVSSLTVRALALAGRHHEAAARATSLAAQLEHPLPARQRWADWQQPPDTCRRVRLELVRWSATCPLLDTATVLDDALLLRWLPDRRDDLRDADLDRLASAILQRSLAVHGPDTEVWEVALAGLRAAVTSPAPRAHPLRRCHSVVVPVIVAVARRSFAQDFSERAFADLSLLRRLGRDHGDGLFERAADRAELELRRAGRQTGGSLAEHLSVSADPADRAAALTLLVLTEPTGAQLPEPSDVHLRWRCYRLGAAQPTIDRTMVAALLDDDDTSPLASLRRRLDQREARLAEPGVLGPERDFSQQYVDLQALAEDPAATAEEQFRQLLRVDALGLDWTVYELPRHPRGPANEWPSADGVIDEYEPRLGLRRMAELAMEEGELLALRLPDSAVRPLRRAAQWFAAAGDPLGELIAETARAMAAIRTGTLNVGTATLLLDGLKELDKRRRDALNPDRDETTATTPPIDPFMATAWRQRFDACVGWLTHRTATYSTYRRPAGPVAHELDFPAHPDVRTPAVYGSQRLRIALRGLNMVQVGIAAVGVGALLAAPFAFGVLEFGDLLPGGSTLGGATIVLLAYAAVISAVVETWARRRSDARRRSAVRWRGSTAVVRLRRSTAPVEPASGVLASISAIHYARPWLRLFGVHPQSVEEAVAVSSAQPYVDAAAAVPEPVRELFATMADRGGDGCEVVLEIDANLQQVPWEAVLTPQHHLNAWRLVRPLPEPFHSDVEAAPPVAHLVKVIAGPAMQRLVEEAWLPVAPVQYLPRPSAGMAPVWSDTPSTAAYAIGSPFRPRGTIVLQIGASETSGSPGAEWTVEPRDLASTGATVLVVQGIPTDATVRRETAREESAELRTFAAEACTGGVMTVVVVPSLPTPLARRAAQEIAAALRVLRSGRGRHGAELEPLLAAVHDLRTVIAAESDAEAAWDLCVLHRPIVEP